MKVIIPLAGLGTRLRPHTLTRPKPLVSVAGKPILGHVLDRLEGLPISETIFITGYLGQQIEEYVRSNYSIPSRFVEQKELKGQAHAINLTSKYLSDDEPVLIIFVDTIFEADLTKLLTLPDDGAIFVKHVDDPSRFGVVVLNNDGIIERLVEKPKTPVSNLAVVGIYYLKETKLFVDSLEELLSRNIQTAGEFYLADALQLMVDKGAKLRAFPIEVWEDTGTTEALLETNRYLLAQVDSEFLGEQESSLIIPPVYAGPGVKIVNSIVGPNVSISAGAQITDSILRDCIVGENAIVECAIMTNSIIGSNASLVWHPRKLSVSDFSQMEVG